MIHKVIYKRLAIWLALFLTPWLIALAVPDVRAQFRLQADGLFAQNAFSYYGWSPTHNLPFYRLRSKSIDQLENEHPDDVRVALLAAEKEASERRPWQWGKPKPPGYHDPRVQELDNLIRRFPQHSWLIASRIRTTTNGFKDDRVGGVYEDINTPPLNPPPTKSKTPPSFSSRELQTAIAAAQLGRRVEPQNSFYDWWLAYFLYAGYRDAEALKVLHEGAQKQYYDDHSREDVQARLFVHSQVHPETAESKSSIVASQLFPHYAPMYHFVRLLAWHCHEEKTRGHHQQALQVVADVMRLNKLMRNYGYIGLDLSIPGRLSEILWTGIVRDFTPAEKKKFSPLPEKADILTGMQSTLAVAYARGHGDVRTASLIAHEATAIIQSRATQKANYKSGNYSLGLHRDLENTSITLWMGTQILLFQIALLTGLLLLLLIIAWPFGMEPVQASPRDVTRTTGVCWFFFSLAVAVMYFGGIGLDEIFGERLFCGFLAETSSWVIGAALVGLWMPAILPALIAVAVTLFRRRKALKAMPVVSTTEGIVKPAAKPLYSPADFLTLQSGFIGEQFAYATGQLTLWLLRIATGVTFSLFVLSLGNAPRTFFDYGSPDGLFAWLVIELVIWCFVWVVRARWWQKIKQQRTEAHMVLRWYRGSILTYLMLTGWVYLALSLVNIAPRREAMAEVDRFVQLGEKASFERLQRLGKL
ncbi:MAG TPA: hypothetical protein VF719_01375 [Abditibacteriaceae bacterium]